jgi:Domain of unknown function (DUF4124)
MRQILFTLMCLGCTVAPGATVYKWVDDNGVVHYSDQPHENAQKVELKASQTYSAPKLPNTPVPRPPEKSAPYYQSCAISTPENDQVFPNATSVTAGVNVIPAVRPGDSAVVSLDGLRVPGVPASGGQFSISPIDRGTHTIQVVIQDAKGNPVCQSKSVTFHVQQPSLLNPASPLAPNRPALPH